jgi:hypothetical protein
LVDTFNKTDVPFVTTQDNTFVARDIVFDPKSWYESHHEVIAEYGFRGGNVQQRARYILVVPMVNVEIPE